MYRPVCSQLMLIVLLALQTMTSFRTNVLLAQEYSAQRILIDGVYVEQYATGAELYTRVDHFSATKVAQAQGGGRQPLQPQAQHHIHQAEYMHQAAPDHNHHDLHHLSQHQQQQMQAQNHHHQQVQSQQQQVQPAQHRQHPYLSSPELQQAPHHDEHQLNQQAHQHQHPQSQQHDHHQHQQQQQQAAQYHKQQVNQQPPAFDSHAENEAQHHQIPLQYLHQPHQLQVPSHFQRITEHFAWWRTESKHDVESGSVGYSLEVVQTTYPLVHNPVNQHHYARPSCNSIDDSSLLWMQNHLVLESTCDAAPAARFPRDASDHVPPYAHHNHHSNNNNNKPSRNSNVESFPLAPQHYHYDSSLMTAIRHYWREISGLCLVTAIFLNWLFVVVKRRFMASGLTRHMAEVASSEQQVVDSAPQRLSTSSSTASPPKSISKDTTSTFNNSAHDSAFEENASPISLDDADDTSQESSLSSRPRSLSSTPCRHGVVPLQSSSLNNSTGASEYISRYSSDFDSIRRLGRGGFGIVFEAKNKIDDCHYAVKRICLPLEKEARERVMREVRALAKLDHAGIVRYYNAWLETPPDEWLKQHDALLGIVHTRDGLSFPSTDGICERNYSNLNNTNGFNIGDRFGESGDISNLDFYGNTKSPFDNKRRTTGYSSDYLKENSSSPSLDIVFEGSGSIRLEAENNTEESEIKVASPGLHLEKVYLYIQMQLCRKDTLKDWLRTNCENRDTTTIFDFFYQIVDAVEYVHSQDLIHRDLKPSNIFFSLDGTLKIGDFGLCRAKTNTCVGSSLDLKEYAADFSDAVHTEQVGTQLYMSPEQMNGLSYNHKVDIFAMGLILLELLIPFKTQMQRVNVLLKARTNMFSREFKREHPDEHDLVRSLLDRRPHKRPTASAIKEHDLLANAQLSQPVIERIYHRRRTISSNSSSE